MGAYILDTDAVAKKYAARIRNELREGIALATIRATNKQSAIDYQQLLEKDCAQFGIGHHTFNCQSDEGLVEIITHCNDYKKIHGILVLYPLGDSIKIDKHELANGISPEKDVEGLHKEHVGALFQGYHDGLVVPCTAKAIVETLKHHDYEFKGNALIINRSDVVGKPLRSILEELGMTVLAAYDKTSTRTIDAMLREADLIVTAVPDPTYKLPTDAVKKGAAVVAVSPGNIDEAALKEKCSLISVRSQPIGRVTRKITLHNLCLLNHAS